MTFIYKPKSGVVGKIYEKFIRNAVSAECVRKIFVYGQSEIAYYSELFGVSQEKFVFVRVGIDDKYKQFQHELEHRPSKFYIAPGRSNRDYDFLSKSWKRKETLKVVCDIEKHVSTEKIHYETHLFGDEYLTMLARAYAVIVPLKDVRMSSGQLVFLQAGMFGKPVIVTQNDTVSDYIVDGSNGFIIAKSEAELNEKLNILDDADVYKKMSENARRMFIEKYDLFSMGQNVGRNMLGR